MNAGQRFARFVTDVVVRRPALWRVLRGPLRAQFDKLAPVWDELPQRLLAIAGELDERYAAIARRMGRPAIVPGAGHAAHLEQPERVAALLREFLDENLGDRVVVDRDA